jgi:hypothetical protein
MKRSRFTEEQIIAILREQEAGSSTADVGLAAEGKLEDHPANFNRPIGYKTFGAMQRAQTAATPLFS